jgi:hypothetical protein
MSEEKLDMSDLINMLAQQYNIEVDNFDSLVQQLDDSRGENEELAKTLREINSGIVYIEANAKKHMALLNQALIEKNQAIDALDLQKTNMALYKQLGTPKKIREQIKNYKVKAAENLKTIELGKTQIKGYKTSLATALGYTRQMKLQETEQNMTAVWSENGDHLMIFPAPLTMKINDRIEKQMSLLYMTNSGAGRLIGLDEEGEPLMCSAPKGGVRPKKATMEAAGRMLRKWKKQGWRLSDSDLRME